VDDTRKPADMSEDAIIAALFAAAERNRLPDEPAYDEAAYDEAAGDEAAYDEAAVLRRFDAWLDANTETAAEQVRPIEPRRLDRGRRRPVRYGSLASQAVRRSPLPDGALASKLVPSSEDVAGDVSPIIFSTGSGGVAVQRLVLGSQLRRLRESHGITAEQAAEAIRGSHSKISRMEHGRVGFKERDVADLLTLYGVTDNEERAALLNLAREANTPGWWHAYSDVLPSWLTPYVGLEAAASVIRTYQIQFVPGLLQTEGYARALIRQGSAATEEQIARRGELRASRQEILRRPDAPQLWVVVDEGALRRPVGSREIVREQLEHLIEVADHPAVTLQILPFSAGAHSAMGGAFTILRFAEPDLADVVYIEQLTSALYLDKPVEVDSYLEVMEQLCLQAEPIGSTAGILRRILAAT
jgi:transcriptional regulator with XRE-family HTH domain